VVAWNFRTQAVLAAFVVFRRGLLLNCLRKKILRFVGRAPNKVEIELFSQGL